MTSNSSLISAEHSQIVDRVVQLSHEALANNITILNILEDIQELNTYLLRFRAKCETYISILQNGSRAAVESEQDT